MPRMFWRLSAAFGLWAALSAQHPNPTTSSEQRHTDQRVGDALTNIAAIYGQEAERAKRTPKRPPCGPGNYQGSDDLCAQWKAADAAEKAAWWAAFAGWFGGLSFIGVVAAVALAFQSNRIARDTARRQLRAYISVEPGGVNEIKDDRCRVPLLIINDGQTPAFNIMIFGNFALTSDPVDFNPAHVEKPMLMARASDGALNPAQKRWIYPYVVNNGFVGPRWGEIANMELALVHFGYISYDDAFGTHRETHFAFYHWGEELSDVDAKRCAFGNTAT